MTGLQGGRGESLEVRNDVLDHLMQAGLSGTEWSLALVVIQALSRHGKNEVPVSLREFHGLVRLDQEAIRKGIKTLRERNILIQNEPQSFTKPASWSFNENWAAWVSLDSRRVLWQHTPQRQHTESPTPAQRRVLQQHTVSVAPRQEVTANTKDAAPDKTASASATMININKPIFGFEKNKSSPGDSPSPEALTFAGQLRAAVRSRDPKSKAGMTENLAIWARDIDLLMRIDKRAPEEIRRVIDWCQSPGGFWGPNILSGRKLREKFDTLSGQMLRETCEARYEPGNGNHRVPQILNNRAEREYVPVKEPVRI